MKSPKRNLLAEFATAAGAAEMLLIKDGKTRHTFEAPVVSLSPDPSQPRKRFDPASISSLSQSLQSEGLLHPILVRKAGEGGDAWIIVAGERRWRAAREASWEYIACIEVDARLATRIALIENLQRVDLTPLEEAQGISDNLSAGLSLADVATMIGRSKSDVSETVRLLDLSDALKVRLQSGELSFPKATLLEIAKAGDAAAQEKMCEAILARKLTSKEARALRSDEEGKGGDKTSRSGARTFTPKLVNTFRSRLLTIESGESLTIETRGELEALASDINKLLSIQ